MTHLREEHLVCAQLLIDPCNRSVRSTAVELGVSESTLRYRLKRRQAALCDGRTAPAEACSAHAAVIEAWMADQQEMLQSGRRRPRPRIRPVRRVEVGPGCQAQVDWVEPVVDVRELGGRTRLSAFNLTLSFSRMFSVQWRLDPGQLSWQEAHNRSFLAVEGVPWSVRFDNCKTAVAHRGGPWAILHADYASYAAQLGFVPDACRIRVAGVRACSHCHGGRMGAGESE